jgi:hypothetical protein
LLYFRQTRRGRGVGVGWMVLTFGSDLFIKAMVELEVVVTQPDLDIFLNGLYHNVHYPT